MCLVSKNRRRRWHPTPVLLPGNSHGWRSLVVCSPWGCEESDTTEWLPFHFSLSCIGEGNGNSLQRSCLENPRTAEQGGLLSMGLHRVRHDWSNLAAAVSKNKEYMNWENPNGCNLNLSLHEASTWIFAMNETERSGSLVSYMSYLHCWTEILPSWGSIILDSFFSSVQFSCSVVSDSLWPRESQHTRPPCPSPTPRVHSDSRPSSQWCHPAISSSVVPLSSCPQSLPASESSNESTLPMR